MHLKQARVARGLTQHQLAELLGVSQAQISIWENGEDAPSEDRQRMMDTIFGPCVEWGQEFAPLDDIENVAVMALALELQERFGTEESARIINTSTKYELRRLARAAGYLEYDYVPLGARPAPLGRPGITEGGE